MATKKITCTFCGSDTFVKKGTTKNARLFQCKNCGKRFKYFAEDLIGTGYELGNETTPPSKKKVDETTKSAKNIADKVTDKTIVNENIDYKTIDDIDLGKVKKDDNGNFLLRIGNKPPMPIGNNKEDLITIVRKHGGNCSLKLGSDGIFVLSVNTTTKGMQIK